MYLYVSGFVDYAGKMNCSSFTFTQVFRTHFLRYSFVRLAGD